MSKKITISVPDFLHEKMEAWRDTFNLSRIFQDAVSNAIKKKEDIRKRMKEDLSIPEIIERLKKEKQEVEDDCFERGEQSGLEWARRAHYFDLRNVLRQPVEALAGTGGSLQDYFKTTFRQENLSRFQGESFNEYRKSFLSGWKQGVVDFWNIVKNKLEEK